MNLSGTCQKSTASQAYAPGIDLNAHVQEIARDLQVCELVKLERDAQAGYITSLKFQLTAESMQRAKKEKEAEKLIVKIKRRGKIIVALLVPVVVMVALTILNQ